ncbi:MAG TPA: ATP-binding cassette domain-containing protein, partial [Gemmatimonadales bacterium]|nr:ATP-binding cassette domain-containing protein [Gemmatimonadales bacterium]
VLTSATLRAEPGCITALVGRNGIGKSTLVKIAAGWLRADHGTVRFRDRLYEHAALHRLAEAGLFYLPDRALLSPGFSVREHLDSAARRWGRDELQDVVRRTGIGPHLERRPSSLSEGELRRAELALALLRGPACLLADEPYRGLAPYDREALTEGLRHLAGRGCAVVVTGHEVQTLWDVADTVVWCTDGTTYELGSPASAAEDWRFRQGFLASSLGG